MRRSTTVAKTPTVKKTVSGKEAEGDGRAGCKCFDTAASDTLYKISRTLLDIDIPKELGSAMGVASPLQC